MALDASFVDIIGMPRPAVQPFLDHIALVVRHAKKGKGRATPLIKQESDGDIIFLSD